MKVVIYVYSWISGDCLRRWCSGNINAFQAFALGSIPGRRSDIRFVQRDSV